MEALVTRRAALLAAASLGTGAALQAAAAGSSPDLAAVVRHETQQRLPSGITRTEQWSERFVRQGEQVWSERVLPPGAARHADEAPGSAHRHFDFESAARWVRRDGDGRLQLRFAAPQQQVVVTVPRTEYGAVGFDGRWDTAAHLVPPLLIAAMPQEATGSPIAGARWHVQREQGWTHRVLWSPALQVALRIESRRDDGSASRTVVLEPAAASTPRQAPWVGLERWTQREYGDYLD